MIGAGEELRREAGKRRKETNFVVSEVFPRFAACRLRAPQVFKDHNVKRY